MEEDPNVMRRSRGQGFDYTRAPKSYALSGKIMLSAIIILFSAVILILFLHIYARCCLVRRRRTSRRGSLHPNAATPSAPRGLDAAVLRSLPVFVFSSKTHHQDPLECAVCLSEFEDGEKGRLLPKCNHRFHIDCIDMWFHSHSACPLCRSDVKPDSPKPNPAPGLENLGEISVGDVSNGDLEAGCSSSEQTESPSSSSSGSGSSSSSSSSSSEICSSSSFRKKALGCVGMAIEVPTRRGVEEVEIAVVSPGVQGLKSPGSRILALKRILSRDRKVVTETADLERGEEQPNQNCS